MKTSRFPLILFALCGTLSLGSCDKNEPAPAPEALYFEANMNGKTLLLPEGKDGYLSKATAATVANASGCSERQSLHLTKAGSINKSVEVIFLKQRNACASSFCEQSKAMLQQGQYAFGRQSTTSDATVVDGVVVRYVDVYGEVWSTDFGSADQTGSSFTVTALSENKADAGSKMMATVAFNCTLYNEAGEEIVVTDGKVVSRAVVCL